MVVNPSSFSDLEEYRDAEGEEVLPLVRPPDLSLQPSSPTRLEQSLESEGVGNIISDVSEDANVVILSRFEDNFRRLPAANFTHLSQPPALEPRPSPKTEAPVAPPMPSFPNIGFETASTYSREGAQYGNERESDLVSHYRNSVRRHLVQIRLDSLVVSPTAALGLVDDIFEQEAAKFPPVWVIS